MTFPMTQKGYLAAKEYLITINKLKELENNMTSVDGYSLVHFANSLKKKNEQT